MVWAVDLDAPKEGFNELQCAAAQALYSGSRDNSAASDTEKAGNASTASSLSAGVLLSVLVLAAVLF